MPKRPQNYIDVVATEYGAFASHTIELLELTTPGLHDKKKFLVLHNRKGYIEIKDLWGDMLLETDSDKEADKFLLHFEF